MIALLGNGSSDGALSVANAALHAARGRTVVALFGCISPCTCADLSFSFALWTGNELLAAALAASRHNQILLSDCSGLFFVLGIFVAQNAFPLFCLSDLLPLGILDYRVVPA